MTSDMTDIKYIHLHLSLTWAVLSEPFTQPLEI
jgi:hypothetical protein